MSCIFQTRSKTEYKQEIERLKEELKEQQERESRKIRDEEERRKRLEEENRRLKVRAESVEEELKQAVGQLLSRNYLQLINSFPCHALTKICSLLQLMLPSPLTYAVALVCTLQICNGAELAMDF